MSIFRVGAASAEFKAAVLLTLGLAVFQPNLSSADSRCSGTATLQDKNGFGILKITGDAARDLYDRLSMGEIDSVPESPHSHHTVKIGVGVECRKQILTGSPFPGPDGHLSWPSSERYFCELVLNEKGIISH